MGMALMLVSLAGCGLKGPLYFPPEETPQQNKPTEQQNTQPSEQQKQAAQQADTGGIVTGNAAGMQAN